EFIKCIRSPDLLPRNNSVLRLSTDDGMSSRDAFRIVRPGLVSKIAHVKRMSGAGLVIEPQAGRILCHNGPALKISHVKIRIAGREVPNRKGCQQRHDRRYSASTCRLARNSLQKIDP